MGDDGFDPRIHARQLAAAAWHDGEPLRWFEELYQAAEEGTATVPWADRVPHPLLVSAIGDQPLYGQTTLVTGCGLGDDAAWLASRGALVTAFDIAPTAVHRAAARFRGADISWAVADLLALPAAWRGAFDRVVEISTLQCLPRALRQIGLAAVCAALVAGGELFAIERAREPDEPEGTMPWPLTRAELEAVTGYGCEVVSLDAVTDDETPPVQRFVLVARRTKR